MAQIFKSARQLAVAVGVAHSTINEYLAREDCPIPHRPPWTEAHLKVVKEWRQYLQQDRSNPSIANNPGRVVDVRLKMERLLKLKLEREILADLFIDRGAVEQGWAQRAAYFRQSLENLPDTLAATLVGMEAPEIASAVKKRINEILDGYQQKPRPGIDS